MSSSAASFSAPRIRVAGTGGLVVEFGSVVDETLNRLVMALDARFRGADRPGVIETVPTYRSLLVIFDPLVADRRALADELARLCADLRLDGEAGTRLWTVPVAYGGAFGEDLEAVASLHGLDRDEVVRAHAGSEYRVFMIGFAPGFAYLGGLPGALQTPRRLDPRQRIPAGSITIGGLQAAVTSIEAPSGWHILGRTPLRTFDLRRSDPFLFRPGDRVRFRAISAEDFARLSILAETGAVTADLEEHA